MKASTGQPIERIKLHYVKPDVFTEEDVAGSEIWLHDFTFERGRHYMIEAASGSGKSSLCSFIYRNRTDYCGTISYDSSDARMLSADEVSRLRCRHIALLPQELRLFGELTALDNVMLKNKLTNQCSDAEIKAMFEQLGIVSKLNSPASQLSIGQMQRVALIRALCQPFDFILLDEPVSHLDEINNRAASSLIFEHAERYGASVITTSVGNRLAMPSESTIFVKL